MKSTISFSTEAPETVTRDGYEALEWEPVADIAELGIRVDTRGIEQGLAYVRRLEYDNASPSSADAIHLQLAEQAASIRALSAAFDSTGVSAESATAALLQLCDVPRIRTPVARPSTTITGPARPSPVVHESPHWEVREALDAHGAVELGRGTAWCTARVPGIFYANHYAAGDLYVLRGVNGNRAHRRTRFQLYVSPSGDIECERHDGRRATIEDLRGGWPELAPWLDERIAIASMRRH